MSSSRPCPVTADVTKIPQQDLGLHEPGIELQGLGLHFLDIEGQVGQEVGLGQDQDVRGRKRLGVFLGLVVAFGGREEDEAQPLAQLVARRADQVAHVLDEQELGLGRDLGQDAGDHHQAQRRA